MVGNDYRDYFKVLGVERNCNSSEIKNAFRKLARQYHPDVNPGDKAAEAKFKEISEAYEILSDPEKRTRYEQFGKYWNQVGTNNSNVKSGFGQDLEFGDYGNFDEFINDLLGRFNGGMNGVGGFRANSYQQSLKLDAEITVKIALSEVFLGCKRTLSINDERVQIKIPKGMRSGSKLRVKGKGNFQPGTGMRGDLYIKIDLEEHPIWKINRDHLCADLPVSFDELVLGAIVKILTPDGKTQLSIPKGTLPGQSLRLKGKGLPNNNGRGDLIFTLIMKYPDQWSSKELELLDQLRQLRINDPRKDWLNSARA